MPPTPTGLGHVALPCCFGDYELMEKIGEGGMGEVYKARQVSLDRLVALKMLPLTGPHARPEFIQRFRAEAVAAASLQHPNIVAIHEVGLHEGQHFFAMDYVAGQSLADAVGNRPLPPKQAARYLQGIAEAVHYAHERGILHRDLKPSNILIDAQDQPRVADFGLAKRLDNDSELTQTGQVLGSPHYIPPEQAAGKHRTLSRRGDVYGLGAILYHLLTGRPPFVGEQMAETLQLVLNTDPVAPRLLNPLVPRDLETICLKCLEKEPARRYPTAQDVAEELASFLRGEPIIARPVGIVGRLGRWCRRKPALAGAVGAVIVSVALGLGGVLWQWRQTREHAAAEYQQRLRAEESLARTELERVEDLLEDWSQGATALAWLARVLRDHPNNAIASERIVSVLTWRSFPLPLSEFVGVAHFAWSPDGRRVATGSINGEIGVWSAVGGRPLMPQAHHTAPILYVQFAPEGRRLVSASDDGTTRIWDAASGQTLTPVLRHSNSVMWAEFSSDGQRLVTASADGTARVWDAATGEPITGLLSHGASLFAAKFSPDGRMVLTASWDTSLHLWDTETGRVWPAFSGFRGGVQVAGFSPDSRWVLASDENRVRLWDIATGKEPVKPMLHPLVVLSAEFTPDGQRLLTSCFDGFVRLWEARTGRLLVRWPFLAETLQVSSPTNPRLTGIQDRLRRRDRWGRHAAFSPSGQVAVSTFDDCSLHVWRPVPSGGMARKAELILQDKSVRAVSFSPDGLLMLSWLTDGTARVWDIRPGQALPVKMPVDRPLIRAHFHPEGRWVMTLDAAGRLQKWDALSGLPDGPALNLDNSARCADFTAKGQHVATATTNHLVRVWDTRTGECHATLMQHRSVVNCLRHSPDGHRLVTASEDGAAGVWQVPSGTALALLAHDAGVACAAFNPDGQRVVTGSRDGGARVWDVRTGQLAVPPLRDEHGIQFVEFTPDGRRVVTACGDGDVRFWDAGTGKPLAPTLRNAGGPLLVRLNSQGTLAATAATDTTLRVSELPSGRVRFTTGRQYWAAVDAQFTSEGSRLATACDDGAVRFWDVSTGLLVTETSTTGGRHLSLQPAPDGQRLLTASLDAARIWEVPCYPVPAPTWLPTLAEAVAGHRLDAQRQLESVPVAELIAIRNQIEQSTATDPYTRWAKWFFADRATRPQSPGVTCTFTDHLRRLMERNTPEDLHMALRYSPTNREAFARLAKVLRATNTKSNAVIAAEADWCEHKAKEPVPR